MIDARYRDLLPTLFTTNLNCTLLQQAIGERSYSRLREEGIWAPLEWMVISRKTLYEHIKKFRRQAYEAYLSLLTALMTPLFEK